MISIIIPVYNASLTLRHCVDSIISQSFFDWELILINDGSTDDSGFLCDEYANIDSRISVIHKTNGGVSSARNIGLDLAKGEWITFIDSDDYVSIDYLQAIENTQSDMVITECYHFDMKNKPVLYQPFGAAVYSDKQSYLSFMTNNLNKLTMLTPWAKFFKKDIIGSDRFRINQRLGEDSEFVFRYYAKINTAEVSNKGLYYYYDVPSHFKYKLTLSEALEGLNNVYMVYEILPFRNSLFESLELSLFCYVCRYDLINSAHRWFRSPVVRKMFVNAKLHMDRMHRMKYILFQIPYLFRIYHFFTKKWV